MEPDRTQSVSIAGDIHDPRLGGLHDLVHDQVGKQPRCKVVRTELALEAIRRLRILGRHDAGIIHQDVDVLRIGVDFGGSLADFRQRSQVKFQDPRLNCSSVLCDLGDLLRRRFDFRLVAAREDQELRLGPRDLFHEFCSQPSWGDARGQDHLAGDVGLQVPDDFFRRRLELVWCWHGVILYLVWPGFLFFFLDFVLNQVKLNGSG